jgi:hypothetical protein
MMMKESDESDKRKQDNKSGNERVVLKGNR